MAILQDVLGCNTSALARWQYFRAGQVAILQGCLGGNTSGLAGWQYVLQGWLGGNTSYSRPYLLTGSAVYGVLTVRKYIAKWPRNLQQSLKGVTVEKNKGEKRIS